MIELGIISDTPQIQPNIIEKDCPICRKNSKVDLNMDIFTGGTTCNICMDEKDKMVLFQGCGHALICKECFQRL